MPQLHPLRALAHPLWIVSLLVLVLNDHWLKGAHIAPGWLTGKLSDFAGLVVAPPLFAALLRVRSRRALVVAYAAVAIVFAMLKTLPIASVLYDRVFALLGANNVVDPSDLVALLVLPLGHRVLRERMAQPWDVNGWSHRALMALGSIACMATPKQMGNLACYEGAVLIGNTCVPFFTSPFFVGNLSKESETVTIRPLRDGASCKEIEARASEGCALADQFGAPRTLTLRPLENEPIVAIGDECSAALITIDAWHPPVLAVRRSRSPSTVPYMESPAVRGARRSGGVYLRNREVVGEDVDILPFICKGEP